jgi:hypothetical protein
VVGAEEAEAAGAAVVGVVEVAAAVAEEAR